MILDILCLVVGAYGFYWGYHKGILKTLLLIGIYLLMLVVAVRIAPYTINLFENLFNSSSPLLYIVGFVATIVAAIYVSRWANNQLKGIFDSKSPNSIHQIAGAAICSWFFLLLYSILIWFFNESRMITNQSKQDSLTYTYTQKIPDQARFIVRKSSPYLGEVWDKTISAVQALRLKELQENDKDNSNEKRNYSQKTNKRSSDL